MRYAHLYMFHHICKFYKEMKVTDPYRLKNKQTKNPFQYAASGYNQVQSLKISRVYIFEPFTLKCWGKLAVHA